MAFTKGSGTFTQGSATVTGVTLTQGNTGYFASGTRVEVGEDPLLEVVEAIAAPSAGTFTLREPWGYSTGEYNFSANMTSEGLRDAVSEVRSKSTQIQQILDKLNAGDGVSGTFTTTDGKTITVTDGIITGIA